MKSAHDIIKGIITTEKGSMVLRPQNKYLFWVASGSNKIEIRHAVEEMYKVKVESVNTMFMRGKSKRIRYAVGYTSDWKKAVVTLKEGSKIDAA